MKFLMAQDMETLEMQRYFIYEIFPMVFLLSRMSASFC